jgi:hypothetical protein
MAAGTIAAWAAVASVAVSAGSAIYQNQNKPTQDMTPQAQIADKTGAIEAGTVDEALIGDEESLKRKKQSAKAKFKSDLLAEGTADTSTGLSSDVFGGGVQI